MPRVPTYDNFQELPTGLPQQQLRIPDAPDVAGQQSRQMAQSVGKLQVDFNQSQDLADQLRVDDALNKVREESLRLTHDKDAGYTNLKGLAALQRESGKPLGDEYAENLQKHVEGLSSSLGSDRQRQMFQMRANDMVVSLRGNGMQHEAEEFKNYNLSVQDGTIATRTNEIALNSTNPKLIDEGVNSIRAAVYAQGKLLGKSAEWIEAQAKKMTSNAHVQALTAVLEKPDSAGYAEKYLEKYAEQMDADDMLRVRGVLVKAKDAEIVQNVTAVVMGTEAKNFQTSDVDRAWNIAVQTESSGKQFDKDGKPLVSPAGAVGIAQVMPLTGPEAAKLAGLAWDEVKYRTDAKYNETIGKAYFNEQVKTFKGDLSKVYAAYNAGPWATQKAIKKAEKEGGDWLAYLPDETQKYVVKNMNAYGKGEGANTRPTLNEVLRKVDLALGENATPNRRRLAQQEATRQYDLQTKALKVEEDAAVTSVMQVLEQNGGKMSAVPPTLLSRVPPGNMDKVYNYGERIAKGDDTTNPALYLRLSNPQALRNMSQGELYKLRDELSDSDFKHFAKEQQKLLSGGGKNAASDLNTAAINRVVRSRLDMLGRDSTPKDGSAEAARLGALRSFIDKSVLTEQATLGRMMNDTETVKFIDGLFAKQTRFMSTFLGFETGAGSKTLLDMKIGDIPSSTRKAIEQAFKTRGVAATDADILGAYWRGAYAKEGANK